jgi:hypothetical protein
MPFLSTDNSISGWNRTLNLRMTRQVALPLCCHPHGCLADLKPACCCITKKNPFFIKDASLTDANWRSPYSVHDEANAMTGSVGNVCTCLGSLGNVTTNRIVSKCCEPAQGAKASTGRGKTTYTFSVMLR